MPLIKNVIFVMIPLVVASEFLTMLSSLKISIFSTLTWIVLIHLLSLSLPGFSDKTTVIGFQPDFVYYRREKPTVVDARPPDPSPAIVSTATHNLHRSSRTSRPSERYGFTHTSLMTTLFSISIPSSYLQVVQHDSWN